MKTRINFYQKAIRVKRDPVPFKVMLALWLVTLCVVALTWLFYLDEEHKSLQLVTQSEAYLTNTEQQLSVVKQRLADKQNKSHLIDELKVLQQEILHKQQVFDYLENTSMHTKTDYADVMRDLAAYHEPQIWLSQIKFDGQKIINESMPGVVTQMASKLEGLIGPTDVRGNVQRENSRLN